jgi:hypothetical protein
MWGSGMEGSSGSLVQVGRLYKLHAAEPFFDEVDEEAKRETPEFEAAEILESCLRRYARLSLSRGNCVSRKLHFRISVRLGTGIL